MAIGARISPELLVHGRVAELRKKEFDGEYTGTAVTIDTIGGPLVVSWRPNADDQRPAVGRELVVVASAYDGARGSSLTFERYLQKDQLEAVAATFGK
jgi:hypothetical protein